MDVPTHGATTRRYPVVRLADFGLSKDIDAEVRLSLWLSALTVAFCSQPVLISSL
jgi:hypothetical protein